MGAIAPLSLGVLTASISRQAGGLFGVIPPLARNLSGQGYAVSVFSMVDKFTSIDSLHLGDVRLVVCNGLGPQAFGYASELRKELDSADLDLVHTHGLWMYPSVAALRWAARWQKPLVVSPHGMLDSWALQNSRWKKRIAGWLYENRHLRSAACLHALNDAEYVAIRAYGLTNPVAIIPNGVELPELDKKAPPPDWSSDLDGMRVLLFLGRLHPKKGLANLLRAWARTRQAPNSVEDWRLVIAGWDQGGHEAELKRLAESLKLAESVRFIGPQFGAQKTASLARADAFILPSLSEGLPMAVLEAWAHSLPVLMTAQCNLPEGFASGAAVEIHPKADRMVEGLEDFLELPDAERLEMGKHGRQLVEAKFAWDGIAGRMAEVYRWLAKGGERPACVRD